MARIIYLGNAAVHPDINRDPARPGNAQSEPPAESVTVVHPPGDASLYDVLTDVARLWQAHSTADPAWVASDDARVAEMLAAQFGDCPVKGIDDAETEYATASSGGAA